MIERLNVALEGRYRVERWALVEHARLDSAMAGVREPLEHELRGG